MLKIVEVNQQNDAVRAQKLKKYLEVLLNSAIFAPE